MLKFAMFLVRLTKKTAKLNELQSVVEINKYYNFAENRDNLVNLVSFRTKYVSCYTHPKIACRIILLY